MFSNGNIFFLVIIISLAKKVKSMGQTPDGWWEKSKALTLTDENFFDIVGKEHYVFVDFYFSPCHPTVHAIVVFPRPFRKQLLLVVY